MEISRGFHYGKRRGTPIPVLPPRIPTPMPLKNNNNIRCNPTKEQKITISTISAQCNVDSRNLHQSNHLIRCPPDGGRLITKQSYKLLDNDVKTAWINPRFISKVDVDALKQRDYSLPHTYDRYTPPRQSGPTSVDQPSHHHQLYHQRLPPGYGRACEREWGPAVNGQSRYDYVSHSAVPAPIQATSDQKQRKRLPCKVQMDNTLSQPRAITSKKSRLPTRSHNPPSRSNSSSSSMIPTRSSRAISNSDRIEQLEKARNLVGYHRSAYVEAGGSNGVVNGVYGLYAETNFVYTINGDIQNNVHQNTAAAAFFARASQKLNLSSPHRRKRYNSEDDNSGFCGALQRCPPSVPPALLRKIGVKEVSGVGKVKVMLRVSNPPGQNTDGASGANSFFSLDKRKKQVTLIDPTLCTGSSAPEDRRVGVAAPKMFAFDAIFSQDDSQAEVCSSALTDVIHAVINGADGCLFCFGHAGLGKSYTMVGSPENANTLGIIPSAIYWLFKGINEQKQKTGARFSVRVSAVEVCGPTNQLKDLLSGFSNDCEQSPGVYLRDDPLFGNNPPHCELRVPTAEKAAHYLDAAIDYRAGASSAPCSSREEARDSHLLFTLHVYQYSVAGKGGVAGGRSRLHLIDLGNSERGKASGGIPLSGLGNILQGIFNGQKHLPYKEHKLTHLLKDCLSSLTCHVAMVVHVSPYAQNYAETLTTVQLASRIHRMRRRKFKFVSVGTGNHSGGSSGEDAGKTSSEPDPSSSDLSADTVIYVGPTDDATDGEHPPVYIPSLNSGDNRGSMSKILRGSIAEQKPSKLPTKTEDKPHHHKPAVKFQSNNTSPAHKNSPKGSPCRNPSIKSKPDMSKHPPGGASDEQWIDGPRISKSKVAEARHMMKEVCHVKKRETWIDGPMKSAATTTGYGYMDSHKKNMIRQWVENQTTQIHGKAKHSNVKGQKDSLKELTQFKSFEEDVCKPLDTRKVEIDASIIRTGLKQNPNRNSFITECQTPEEERLKSLEDDLDDEEEFVEMPPALPLIQPLSSREVSLESLDQLLKERMLSNAEYNSYQSSQNSLHDDDEILEIEEPLEPVPTQDCCFQVTEEDIARCLGRNENPLPESDQENLLDHPLRILSQENLTVVSTFTDSMSVYTDLERLMPRHHFDRVNLYNDDYDDPDEKLYQRSGNLDETTKKKFDQLAKLHELFTKRLANANVANSETYQKQKTLKRCESLSLNDMLYGGDNQDNTSIYSEPAYMQEKFCENCKVTMSRPATAQNWYTDTYFSSSAYDISRFNPPPAQNHIGNRFHRYSRYNKDNLTNLRNPDGASNPNLHENAMRMPLIASKRNIPEDLVTVQPSRPIINHLPAVDRLNRAGLSLDTSVTALKLSHKSEGYDSGHDSTPRTSKHSPAAISRRAESGYDSVVRDSESSSIDSEPPRHSHLPGKKGKCKHKHDKSFCSWFLNPFTCKYIEEPPETHF